jgi:iron complex outermembrane receptor protein
LGIVAQSTANAAAAKVRGVEVELGLLLTDYLHVSLSTGYTDAKYEEFNGFDLTGDGVPDPELARQLRFAHVPDDWTGNLSLVYSRPTPLGEFTARGSASVMGARFAQENNSLRLPGYTLVDGSLSLVPRFNDRLSFSLFVKNATNEYVAINGDSSTLSRHYWGGDPRLYGIEFTYDY